MENVNQELNNEKGCQATDKILCILRETIGEETFCKWAIRGLFCILQTEVLRQNVYAERILKNWRQSSELGEFTQDGTIDKQFVVTEDSVRNLWKNWQNGCTSYRRELSEQQFEQFTSYMQKLSYENPQSEIFMRDLWKASQGIGVLRQTLSKIQEIWKSINITWSNKYAIRKLIPNETWRLMGFSDRDFNAASDAGVSSSQLYKQAGNSIVKQVLMAIFLQLGIQGKPRWNSMSIEDRQKLVDGSLDFLEENRG